jgi:hypothetical protein
MRPPRRLLAILLRPLAASAIGLALVATTISSAAADRDPTPTADQVTAAQSAVTSAQATAQSLDARLTAARDAVATARADAAEADMASHGADALLARASEEAGTARQAADSARQHADDASFLLSLLAAEAYQQGGGMVQLDALLGGDGPQAVLDRAAGLEAVGAERVHAAAEADSAHLLADTLGQAAAEAEQRRNDTAAEARAAAAEAQQNSARLTAQLAALQAESTQLVAQLATLRQTSAALEQARQDGLAAQEQARRDEEARQAGIRAAAEAARQEADRLAAQQAQAQAAERAATTARQAAAAAAVVKAAAQPKPPPTPRPPAATPTPPVPPPPVPPPPASGKPPLNLAMADMWDRIAWCESSQRWHLNLGSGYYGGLQFNLDAWRIAAGFDFAPRPDLASREEQITAANRLYAKLGLKPWTCRTAA